MTLAGVPTDQQADTFGESLVPLLRDEDSSYKRKFAIAQITEATALITDKYKYIATTTGPVLFDLANDPDELRNIAGANQPICSQHQTMLDAWKRSHGPALPPQNTEKLSGSE